MKLGRLELGVFHALGLAVVVLCSGLAWLWLDPATGQVRNHRWTPPLALQPDLSRGEDNATSNPAGYASQPANLLQRPLFAPDRRPPPPPNAVTDPMANIQLLGVFSGSNGGVLARVDGSVRRVRVGEGVGSWTLKSVEGRTATFAQGPDSRQVQLAYSNIRELNAQAASGAKAPSSAGVVGSMAPPQNIQDEMRDRLRRRNEIRAARGLPPVTD